MFRLGKNFTYKLAIIVFLLLLLCHILLFVFYLDSLFYSQFHTPSDFPDYKAQQAVNVIRSIVAMPQAKRAAAVIEVNASPYVTVSLTSKPGWGTQFDKDDTLWTIYQKFIREREKAADLSYHLDDGDWLNISIAKKLDLKFTDLLMIIIEFSVILIVAIYFWTMLRFTKPLRKLSAEAARLGIDLQPGFLYMYGPGVVRYAMDAINKMQDRIADLIKKRTIILTRLAHSLYAPVAKLKLIVQCFDDHEMRQQVMKDIKEIESIAKEMLTFAKQKHLSRTKNRLDIVLLIKSVCDNMQEAGYQVNYQSNIPSAILLGNAMGLKRVFNNLLSNALKYGKKAQITIQQVVNELVIMIDDEGPGLPDEELENVFEPFYRTEQSRSRTTGGIGLGLAIVKEIIVRHQGTIKLSNIPDGGLRVMITFKLDQ